MLVLYSFYIEIHLKVFIWKFRSWKMLLVNKGELSTVVQEKHERTKEGVSITNRSKWKIRRYGGNKSHLKLCPLKTNRVEVMFVRDAPLSVARFAAINKQEIKSVVTSRCWKGSKREKEIKHEEEGGKKDTISSTVVLETKVVWCKCLARKTFCVDDAKKKTTFLF